MFTPQKSKVIIDIQNPQTSAKQLVDEAKPLIEKLLTDLTNSTLNPKLYPFAAAQNSGLSKKIGLYGIVNTKTQKMYLGGASDVSQRKGDHYRSFNNPAKTATKSRLSQPMLIDLQSGSISDFCFVPIITLDQTQVTNLTTGSTLNQQVSNFLDKLVEAPLLTGLFSSHPGNIYNTRTVGAFVAGNKAGGSPASGKPDAPFAFVLNDGQNPPRNFAWESVSAGAKCFGITTKSVRHARDNAKVKQITTAEFNSFTGTKITNANAAQFVITNKADFDILVRAIFPRTANKLGVP